jgi:hypothetical protein
VQLQPSQKSSEAKQSQYLMIRLFLKFGIYNFKQREFLQLQHFFLEGVEGSFRGDAVGAEAVVEGADCC